MSVQLQQHGFPVLVKGVCVSDDFTHGGEESGVECERESEWRERERERPLVMYDFKNNHILGMP